MQFYTEVTDEWLVYGCGSPLTLLLHITLFAAQSLMEFFGIRIACSDSVTLFTALREAKLWVSKD